MHCTKSPSNLSPQTSRGALTATGAGAGAGAAGAATTGGDTGAAGAATGAASFFIPASARAFSVAAKRAAWRARVAEAAAAFAATSAGLEATGCWAVTPVSAIALTAGVSVGAGAASTGVKPSARVARAWSARHSSCGATSCSDRTKGFDADSARPGSGRGAAGFSSGSGSSEPGPQGGGVGAYGRGAAGTPIVLARSMKPGYVRAPRQPPHALTLRNGAGGTRGNHEAVLDHRHAVFNDPSGSDEQPHPGQHMPARCGVAQALNAFGGRLRQ